ncbi:hypothetical protein [Spiroplasma endosymbiont of Panorpa germanica]|uniref:hypothetical protein n=1 Tax=Spiroplasma endosymbiont of Panorpa germanica TaxID=3066314 RepID=UPI0030CD11A3
MKKIHVIICQVFLILVAMAGFFTSSAVIINKNTQLKTSKLPQIMGRGLSHWKLKDNQSIKNYYISKFGTPIPLLEVVGRPNFFQKAYPVDSQNKDFNFTYDKNEIWNKNSSKQFLKFEYYNDWNLTKLNGAFEKANSSGSESINLSQLNNRRLVLKDVTKGAPFSNVKYNSVLTFTQSKARGTIKLNVEEELSMRKDPWRNTIYTRSMAGISIRNIRIEYVWEEAPKVKEKTYDLAKISLDDIIINFDVQFSLNNDKKIREIIISRAKEVLNRKLNIKSEYLLENENKVDILDRYFTKGIKEQEFTGIFRGIDQKHILNKTQAKIKINLNFKPFIKGLNDYKIAEPKSYQYFADIYSQNVEEGTFVIFNANEDEENPQILENTNTEPDKNKEELNLEALAKGNLDSEKKESIVEPKPTPTIPKPTPTIPKPTPTIPKPTPTIPKPTPTIPSPVNPSQVQNTDVLKTHDLSAVKFEDIIIDPRGLTSEMMFEKITKLIREKFNNNNIKMINDFSVEQIKENNLKDLNNSELRFKVKGKSDLLKGENELKFVAKLQENKNDNALSLNMIIIIASSAVLGFITLIAIVWYLSSFIKKKSNDKLISNKNKE